jgi:hypothetical protein
MFRTRVVLVLVFVGLFALMAPQVLFADAYGDLEKVQDAFMKAKSWQAEEIFSSGKTTVVEYSAPDRYRIKPTPDVTELVIGDNIYMVQKGKATKLPFGGGMIKKMVQSIAFSVKDEMKQSARDLGMQTLDGQSVHAYSFTAHGVLETLYVGRNMLPVQAVVNDKKNTTTIKYSKYNTPISIEAQ